MTSTKFYLDVPYAQKDQAKALGARWDAARKKWYIPSGMNGAPFQSWMPKAMSDDRSVPNSSQAATRVLSTRSVSKTGAGSNKSAIIAHTYPLDKYFVAYCGEFPPWD